MPTVITVTKTKSCRIPRRQNHQDPTCTITPTVVHAAAFETTTPTSTPPPTSPRPRRRDAARRHAALDNDRAAFLAARSARLADSRALVIEQRGLDNSTVTITEPLTTKWQTATAWTTAAPSTMVVTVDRVTTVTSVSTKTEYRGVTKVVSTVTAVSLLRGSKTALEIFSNVFFLSLRLPRSRRSTPSSAPLLPSQDVRISRLRPRVRRRRVRLFARQRAESWCEALEGLQLLFRIVTGIEVGKYSCIALRCSEIGGIDNTFRHSC
jgi:hypothetical protein